MMLAILANFKGWILSFFAILQDFWLFWQFCNFKGSVLAILAIWAILKVHFWLILLLETKSKCILWPFWCLDFGHFAKSTCFYYLFLEFWQFFKIKTMQIKNFSLEKSYTNFWSKSISQKVSQIVSRVKSCKSHTVRIWLTEMFEVFLGGVKPLTWVM